VISKIQMICLIVQIPCVLYSIYTSNKSVKSANEYLRKAGKIYEVALAAKKRYDTMKTFADTTFCTCESCTNRECPRKLTRLVLFDAGMMEVPVRVKNFYGSCHDYTEEVEDAVL
jgi:hypothetical protein